MIGFAVCIGSEEKFAHIAEPGIQAVAEHDSIVAELTDSSSIFAAYNEALDVLSEREDLEAVVLLHEDVQLVDPGLGTKLRTRFADPDVAIVGVVGARGVRHLAWWNEAETFGRVLETRDLVDFGGGTHDVDAVDGLFMALSPWAARNLRFDEERYSGFHGYDIDLCFAARAAGKRVLVDEIGVVHHTKGGFGDLDGWMAANEAFIAKWPTTEPFAQTR
jgi:glycosyl transferase family 2